MSTNNNLTEVRYISQSHTEIGRHSMQVYETLWTQRTGETTTTHRLLQWPAPASHWTTAASTASQPDWAVSTSVFTHTHTRTRTHTLQLNWQQAHSVKLSIINNKTYGRQNICHNVHVLPVHRLSCIISLSLYAMHATMNKFRKSFILYTLNYQ